MNSCASDRRLWNEPRMNAFVNLQRMILNQTHLMPDIKGEKCGLMLLTRYETACDSIKQRQ